MSSAICLNLLDKLLRTLFGCYAYDLCYRCESFYVAPQEKYCLHCGAFQTGYYIGFLARITAVVLFVALLGYILPLANFSEILGFALVCGYGWYISWLIVFSVDNFFARKEKSLHKIQEDIEQQLDNLDDAATKLCDAYRLTEHELGEYWKTLREEIDDQLGVIIQKKNEYHAKEWEIRLIRWHNRIEGIMSDNIIGERTCTGVSECITRVQTSGEAMLAEWRNKKDVATLNKGRECIARLEASLMNCEKIQQDLLAKQTAFKLKAANRLLGKQEETHHYPFLGKADVFNTKSEIYQFSRGFHQLEVECANLKLNEETRKVLQMK